MAWIFHFAVIFRYYQFFFSSKTWPDASFGHLWLLERGTVPKVQGVSLWTFLWTDEFSLQVIWYVLTLNQNHLLLEKSVSKIAGAHKGGSQKNVVVAQGKNKGRHVLKGGV